MTVPRLHGWMVEEREYRRVAWVLPGWTKPSAVTEEFLGPDIAKLFSESGGTGPLRERVWREFEVHEEDLLVEKTAASAFFPGRCELPGLLAHRGIDTVLITGTVGERLLRVDRA